MCWIVTIFAATENGGLTMTNEVRLIEELRRLADLDPPICSKDKAVEIEVFGRSVTVYCKPFEQFQDTLRQAADRIEELENLRPKGRWIMEVYTTTSKRRRVITNKKFACSECGYSNGRKRSNYCSNCGAKMEGDDG
jgi:hypothetical protein